MKEKSLLNRLIFKNFIRKNKNYKSFSILLHSKQLKYMKNKALINLYEKA